MDTIAALASGVGRSGVAVIRVSGPQVRFVIETVVGAVPPARQAELITLRDQTGSVIDRGLLLFFQGPRSFTGEDVAEFHVHGSPAGVRRLLQSIVAIGAGIRLAEAGEFTRRAFANGKIDLSEVEALGALIDSDTERQQRAAIESLTNGVTIAVKRWTASVLRVLALVEARIDFADEGDVSPWELSAVHDELDDLQRELSLIIEKEKRSKRLRDGATVVIAGPPNAGKSTLLNALIGREAAIVSSVPGTTRDLIEAVVDMDGWPVRLIDTAGLRDAGDVVEVEGVRRALSAVEKADVVVWLGDPVAAPTANSIRVRSKSDLPGKMSAGVDIALSASTGDGLDVLRKMIVGRVEECCGSVGLYVSPRQAVELATAASALGRARATPAEELVAIELRSVLSSFERLIGRIGIETVLDEIFLKFCIGK